MSNQAKEQSDYILMATNKLTKELAEMKKPGGKVGVIYKAVAEQLQSFIQQSEDFAEVFLQTKRPFSDCCEHIVNGVNTGISDHEAYKKAVQFYFPNADVAFSMTISIQGEKPDDEYIAKPTERKERKPYVKKEKVVSLPKKKKGAEKPKSEMEKIQLTLF